MFFQKESLKEMKSIIISTIVAQVVIISIDLAFLGSNFDIWKIFSRIVFWGFIIALQIYAYKKYLKQKSQN